MCVFVLVLLYIRELDMCFLVHIVHRYHMWELFLFYYRYVHTFDYFYIKQFF
jgi:hypothetical protein